jgi:hypothetical protein
LAFIPVFTGAFYFAFWRLCEIAFPPPADVTTIKDREPPMPRMKILNSVEREVFDFPPQGRGHRQNGTRGFSDSG